MTEQPDGRGQRLKPSRRTVIPAVAVAIALGLAVYVLSAHNSASSDSADAPAVAQVRLESLSTPGENPFLQPSGQDQAGVAAPTGVGGAFAGNTPGLFGDSAGPPSCDAQHMIDQLAADPPRQAAWAAALGLGSGDVPSYLNELTPVLLRSDTAVTAYGYANQTYQGYSAVLQAGTSVFINSFGEPKVKCFSGDPLTAPATYTQARYLGPTWTQFRPRSITVIRRAPVVVNNYTVVDVHRGNHHERSAPPPRHDDGNPPCMHSSSAQCDMPTKTGPGTTDPSKTGPRPDPALEAAAQDAADKANQADKQAVDASAKASAADLAAKDAAGKAQSAALDLTDKEKAHDQAVQDRGNAGIELSKAQAALAEAKKAKGVIPADPIAVAKAQADLQAAQAKFDAADKASTDTAGAVIVARNASDAAKADADEKANQATNADAAARSAQGTAQAAQQNADNAQKKAQDGAKDTTPGKDNPAGSGQPQGDPNQQGKTAEQADAVQKAGADNKNDNKNKGDPNKQATNPQATGATNPQVGPDQHKHGKHGKRGQSEENGNPVQQVDPAQQTGQQKDTQPKDVEQKHGGSKKSEPKGTDSKNTDSKSNDQKGTDSKNNDQKGDN